MSRGTVKVLFVVANRERRDRIVEFLNRSPRTRFEIATTSSLEEGIGKVSASTFDLALIDLDLPDCAGLEAITRFKEKAPRVPITILTDGSDQLRIEKSIEMGAQNHAFIWHFDEVSLPSILESAIDRRNMEEMNKTLKVVNSILRHDVLNNLTVIGGSLEIYRMKKDDKFLTSASNAVDKSVDLIKKMKEVEVVISPKEMKMMNLRTVVDDMVKKFQIQGAKMRFDVRGEGFVLADDALGSVFENIINNAFNHSGSDTMAIAIAPRNDGSCDVRISDQGIGIPNEVKPKIWQEGYKHGKSGQSGLGLFIVKKVIERYGGTISVEDNHPKGTVFVMRLRSN
jgi:signal transduction histidine kinase